VLIGTATVSLFRWNVSCRVAAPQENDRPPLDKGGTSGGWGASSLLAPLPGARKKFDGRDALLRVRDGKPNTDAEHRVPTESGLQPLLVQGGGVFLRRPE